MASEGGTAGGPSALRPEGLSAAPCASFWDVPRCTDTPGGLGVSVDELARAPHGLAEECFNAWDLGKLDDGATVCKLHVHEIRPTQSAAAASDAACRAEWFSSLWWRGAGGQREVTSYLAKRPLPVMAWGFCPARGLEPPSNATDPLGLPLASRGQQNPSTSVADVSTYSTIDEQPDAWGDYTVSNPPCYFITDHHHMTLGLALSQVPYDLQEVLVAFDAESKGFKKAFEAKSASKFWEEMHDEDAYWNSGACGTSPVNPLNFPGAGGELNLASGAIDVYSGAPLGQEPVWLFKLKGDVYRALSKHLEMAGVIERKKKSSKEFWQFKIADVLRSSEEVAGALGLLQSPGVSSGAPAVFLCDSAVELQEKLLSAALPKAADYIRGLPKFIQKDLGAKVRGRGEKCSFDLSRAYRGDPSFGYDGCALFPPADIEALYREVSSCEEGG